MRSPRRTSASGHLAHWSVLAHEISVMIVATGLGTLMTLKLILGVLRRLNLVRAPLSLFDG
jgi:hypothetical protein